jgi:bile acid:Na+ symporter, BASS family
MEASIITDVLAPMALGAVMFGLGLGLTVHDFTRVARYPRPVVVGLFTQSVLLTLVAYGIGQALDLAPRLAIGLMLLAASPGGAAACLYSHLARGDVALNLTLTGLNSALALVWLPVVVTWSMGHFLGAGQFVPAPMHHLVQVAAIIVLPVIAGMMVRWRAPDFCDRAEQPIRILAILVLAALVATLFAKAGSSLIDYFVITGVATIAFNVASLAIGYVVPRLARLTRPQAIAISLEIGMHNAALAIVVALSVLRDSEIAMPAVVYGVIMFLTGGLFAAWLSRRPPDPEPTTMGMRG